MRPCTYGHEYKESKKYKESAHISLVAHLISQSSLDSSPIWIPIGEEEVSKYNSIQCKMIWECSTFMLVLHRCFTYLIIITTGLFSVRSLLVSREFNLFEFYSHVLVWFIFISISSAYKANFQPFDNNNRFFSRCGIPLWHYTGKIKFADTIYQASPLWSFSVIKYSPFFFAFHCFCCFLFIFSCVVLLLLVFVFVLTLIGHWLSSSAHKWIWNWPELNLCLI
jgi:hypothetical protein